MFFLDSKMVINISKTQGKTLKRSMWKVPKLFWRRKKKRRKKAWDRYENLSKDEKEKKHQYHCKRNKNLCDEEKEKKVDYMRSYYLGHEKYLLSWFVDFWGLKAIEKQILNFRLKYFRN